VNFGFYYQLGTRLDSRMPFLVHRLDGRMVDGSNLLVADIIIVIVIIGLFG